MCSDWEARATDLRLDDVLFLSAILRTTVCGGFDGGHPAAAAVRVSAAAAEHEIGGDAVAAELRGTTNGEWTATVGLCDARLGRGGSNDWTVAAQ